MSGDHEERESLAYLDGLWKAYSEGRGKLPPPWVTTSRPKRGQAALSAILALYPARPYPTAGEEPWLVRAALCDVQEGPPVLTQLSVEHRENPTTVEVTSNALRGLPIARIRDRANAQLRQRDDGYLDAIAIVGRVTSAERQRARRAATAAKKLPLTRGRKGYPDEHYRRIALRAVEIFNPDREDGGRRDVLNALSDQEDKPYSTVRDWISRARELGYLVPAKQGRTDFRPGPNLYRKDSDDA